MYRPLSSFADLPLPAFEIHGIPEGQDAPAIAEDLAANIMCLAAAGETVSPSCQYDSVFDAVGGRSRRILRWQTGEGNRATPMGVFIDSELAEGRIPALKVEKSVLRYGPVKIRKETVMSQEVFYKFDGWDGEFSYRLFSRPPGEVERVLGLVTVFNGDLCMFPFGGPTEIGSQEATGEIIRLTIAPSRRGRLSFLLHAGFCETQTERRSYCFNGPDQKEGWEDDMRTCLVLAGRGPFNPSTFSPMSGEFALRRTADGAVVEGFFGDGAHGSYGMLSRNAALESVERLAQAIHGYTESRVMALAKSADQFFGERAVADMTEDELRRTATIFQELVKASRRKHETLSVEDYWKPAARRRDAAV